MGDVSCGEFTMPQLASKDTTTPKITEGISLELQTSKVFLEQYSGATLFRRPHVFSNRALEFWTDSSKDGFGIMFQNNWSFGRFPHFSSVPSMTYLELVPIVIGIHLYGSRMANSRIVFVSDNMEVVEILGSQTSKCPNIMHLVRILVRVCMNHNILFKTRFMGTAFNYLCNNFSRSNFQKFAAL